VSLVKTTFPQNMVVGKLFKTIRSLEKLTAEMAHCEDGADERRNAPEC
jgi:hypothetical protein